LANDAALLAPAIERTPLEILETARRTGRSARPRLSPRNVLFDHGDQRAVAGERPEQANQRGFCSICAHRHHAPRAQVHCRLQQDARKRPAGADCRTIRATSSTLPALASMSEGRSWPPTVAAAEHVQRQICSSIVISRGRSVPPWCPCSGSSVASRLEDDLLRRPPVRLQRTASPATPRSPPRRTHPVIARRFAAAQFQPVSVDLPATGAQSLRRVVSLPASTAITDRAAVRHGR